MTSDLYSYRYHELSLKSGRISYIDEGSGKSVLLLHGAPITSLGFMRMIDRLKEGYRVIAPDLPGFGRSCANADFNGRLEDYSRFVKEFCKELNLDGFYIYLFDSAGCIGLNAASDFSTKLSGLILSDTVALPMTGRSWFVRFVLRYIVTSLPMRFLNRKLNLLAWLVATVAPILKPFSRQERDLLIKQYDTPEKRDRVLDIFYQMGWNETFINEAVENIKNGLKRVPTLLIYGQFDPVRIAGAISHYRKTFHDCTWKIIPFEEHFPILGSGEKVAQEIDSWIKQKEAEKIKLRFQ